MMTESRIDKDNLEQQKAFDLIANTNSSLFITGKAGTGKTTFVKRIQEEIDKNFLVLAPTGIAALNVGGQTIHSFFGFPQEVIGPYTHMEVSFEKRLLLQKTKTIIIDEASMVRSDMVDGMDRFLRALFGTHLPFGGKQMLFVGDLFQLPPVVKYGSADEEMLRDLYGEGIPYFYKASVLRRMNLPKIEFTHVYRQKDGVFLDILNRLRAGESTQSDLDILNQNVKDNKEGEDYSITVTSTNRRAEDINNTKLAEIDSSEFCFRGEKEGKIKVNDIPAPEILCLKVGAQVIFCRNDYGHGCMNGTIAKVKELSDNNITVQLENGKEVKVDKMVWESKERVYNKEARKVEVEVTGKFTQYPLKLAWAITIHKSQGMTFDRMHFDLSNGTFMPGQAYVAISRLRTLEGLTLSNRIYQYHIRQNPEILAFANTFNDAALIEDELSFGKVLFDHLKNKDYDGAATVCLEQAILKTIHGDYRNAALIAKKMFDVMLDDECLNGTTKNIPLLKDSNMTCNFLNAVFCLYGGRHEEAIGYADLVLARRACLEAMFIKGKALLALERYEEAFVVVNQINDATAKSEDKIAIDMKQYLFEAKLNLKLNKSNINTCKHLSKLCPEFIPAYIMIRNEALASDSRLTKKPDEKANPLIDSFNDKSVSNEEFEKMITEARNNNKYAFLFFCKSVHRIGEKEESLQKKIVL